MIFSKKIQKPNGLSLLWQKLDQLGTDSEQPSMEEMTAMVKEVRRKISSN